MNRKPGTFQRPPKNPTETLLWIKIVGVGAAQSGKTSLIKLFCESKFSENYQATVGVDYGFKIVKVDEFELRIHLWDMSGAPEYIDIRNELYNQTDGLFVVFDVSNKASFAAAENSLNEALKYGESPSFAAPDVFLVGNKTDLQDKRVVSVLDAKKLSSKHKLTYRETSASSGDGVTKLFQDMLEKIVSRKRITFQTKIVKGSHSEGSSGGQLNDALPSI